MNRIARSLSATVLGALLLCMATLTEHHRLHRQGGAMVEQFGLGARVLLLGISTRHLPRGSPTLAGALVDDPPAKELGRRRHFVKLPAGCKGLPPFTEIEVRRKSSLAASIQFRVEPGHDLKALRDLFWPHDIFISRGCVIDRP